MSSSCPLDREGFSISESDVPSLAELLLCENVVHCYGLYVFDDSSFGGLYTLK
jgi:hypothetical protein